MQASPHRSLRYYKIWLMMGFLLAGILIFLSLTPHPPTADFRYFDKVGHFFAYALLMGWFMQIYAQTRYRRLAIAFISLGVAIEFVQEATGYRTFEYVDIAADTMGVLCAWALSNTAFVRGLELLEEHLPRRH